MALSKVGADEPCAVSDLVTYILLRQGLTVWLSLGLTLLSPPVLSVRVTSVSTIVSIVLVNPIEIFKAAIRELVK